MTEQPTEPVLIARVLAGVEDVQAALASSTRRPALVRVTASPRPATEDDEKWEMLADVDVCAGHARALWSAGIQARIGDAVLMAGGEVKNVREWGTLTESWIRTWTARRGLRGLSNFEPYSALGFTRNEKPTDGDLKAARERRMKNASGSSEKRRVQAAFEALRTIHARDGE